MQIDPPYVLFLGDVADDLAAKTAKGIVDWRREWCLGQVRLPGCKTDAGVPDLTMGEAVERGARTMIIGVVNAGGVLPGHWIDALVRALELGLDLASGLHVRLGSIPQLADAAKRCGRKLFDVRIPSQSFATGKGTKRPGKRLLSVGTDCSVGKKYAALAMERELRARGIKASFRATGQTGIFIAGGGVAVDAVVSDFIAGAAEYISPANDPDHWDIVEGQGSLFHPSFAGVTLGLLHGSQPDAFICCHEPTRTTMRGVATPLPTIKQVIDMTVALGRLTNPAIQCVGLAINTERLTDDAAHQELARLADAHNLPAVDPIRTGMAPIADHMARLGLFLS
jgi:uncharacterized NAD-dependent epimerase/dehydratase family protein